MAGKGFIEEVKMLMEIDSVWKWNIWKSIHHTSNGIKLSIETLKKNNWKSQLRNLVTEVSYIHLFDLCNALSLKSNLYWITFHVPYWFKWYLRWICVFLWFVNNLSCKGWKSKNV